jgi:hypothetical protein
MAGEAIFVGYRRDVGEPERRVAIMAWSKVEGRLADDEGDNIVFHFAGFAERVRANTQGDEVVFI